MTNKPSPQLVELKPVERDRRVNGITGSRALVAELRFDALCAVLVESGAVPRQMMEAMLIGLADELWGQARKSSHPEFQICPDEASYQAHRHRERAAQLASGRADSAPR
jgi:hypothetical protein